MPVIMLCDNGSVRANATLQLRYVAESLSRVSGQMIHPVSFKHADRIAEDKIQGIPANIYHHFMKQQLMMGNREFLLLPMFFGNSKALTSFVPEQNNMLKETFGDFKVDIAEVIYPLPEGEPLLVDIILQHIHATAENYHMPLKNVVLVDHGSPIPRVTEVRRHLAAKVQDKLPTSCHLEQAVMERREGEEYDFNGDLLKHWLLKKARQGEDSALVILLFFLPGRHAGEGGDINEICHSVMSEYSDFNIKISPLITEHPLFITILQKRLQRCLETEK